MTEFWEPRDNVLSVEQVRCTPTVLTDATSLQRFDRMADPEFALAMRPWCVSDAGFTIQYGILQSLVLHEQIVVDSVLIASHSGVGQALALCPEIIRGVYLPFYVRTRIGQRLQRFVTADLGLDTGLDVKEFREFRFADEFEQDRYEEASTQETRLVPLNYSSDPFIQRFKNGVPGDVPSVLVRSSSSFGRAHFYAELARELQIPLAADPHKSRYLQRTIGRNGANALYNVASEVVREFDEQVNDHLEKESGGLVSHDLAIPALAEYILGFAQKNQMPLLRAALEIRNSKNAEQFRVWCGRLTAALAEGRSGTQEQQKLLKELQKVTEAWSKDVDEFVKYETRKVALDKIPVIGGLLKATALSDWKVKDPILEPSKPVSYLLFLNDLLRPPRRASTP